MGLVFELLMRIGLFRNFLVLSVFSVIIYFINDNYSGGSCVFCFGKQFGECCYINAHHKKIEQIKSANQ
jgi:hypothetical protein